MGFNLVLWIVIGVNVYHWVFNYVCALHISPTFNNFKHSDILGLNGTDFQVYRSAIADYPADSTRQSVHGARIAVLRNISQLHRRVGCKKISQYLFIPRLGTLHDTGIHDNKNSHIQNLRDSNDEWFDDNEDSVDWDQYEWPNLSERDKVIALCMEGNELSKTRSSFEEVCKELGMNPGIKISWNGLVRISRKLLNKPAPPSNFIVSLLYETGILSIWRKIFGQNKSANYDKNLENSTFAVDKVNRDSTTGSEIRTFDSPEATKTYRDEDYVFGIAPVMLKGDELIPISETALRGFVGLAYFEHLQKMSENNPKRLQKIMTVLHRIYKRPILISDMKPDDYITDAEILSDAENIILAQSKSFTEFFKKYPNLKWPVTDEDILNLFAVWFNDHEECNSLVELMRKSYGPGINIRFPNMAFKLLVNPLISTISGLSLGRILDSVLKYCMVRYPSHIFSRVVRKNSKTVCTFVVGLLTYIGLSYNSSLQNDVFEYVLKTILDGTEQLNEQLSTSEYLSKVMEKRNQLKSILQKGSIPMNIMSYELEKVVILTFLKTFRRIVQLVDVYENFSSASSSGELNRTHSEHPIVLWNRLCRQLSYVVSICLPVAEVSVYRILYRVACELADSDDLPQTVGGEVLGSEIAEEPGEEDEECYAELYREGNEEAGVPQPNIERNQRLALLFSIFSTQVFSSMVDFQDITAPFVEAKDDPIKVMEGIGLGSADIRELRKFPQFPSVLDAVEDTFANLHKNNEGYLERMDCKPKYGVFLKDDLVGETEQEKVIRENFQVQKLRDSIGEILKVPGKSMEILKSLSMILDVNEIWLLGQFKEAIIDECANLIPNEYNEDVNEHISDFNISSRHIDAVKRRALSEHIKKMSLDLKNRIGAPELEDNSDAKKVSKWTSASNTQEPINVYTKEGLDEYLKKNYEYLLKVSRNMGINKEVALEYFRVLTFPLLLKEMFALDLTTVTNDQMMELKLKYESDDLTFVNALSEAIKKFSSIHKYELVLAKGLSNWYQIERHMDALLTAKVKICSAVCDMIDKSLWYRIERAFRFNRQYVEKEFTHEEIVGNSDALKQVGGDWELLDPPEPPSFMEEAKKRWKEDTKMEPLKVYGVDAESSFAEREEISNLIKEGKLPKEYGNIPTEFHVGEEPKGPDLELEDKPKEFNTYKRTIISSRDAYACWISYCYRKRKMDLQSLKTLVMIFPFLERLAEKTDRDWRRLYIRQRIREGYLTTADLTKELNCTPDEALDVCSVVYEEELLKCTGAFVGHIEEDIGDVGDSYFSAFNLSIYNRLNYLYSEKLPDDVEMEKLHNMQRFLNLPEQVIKSIHSKCFSFAFDKFVALKISENTNKPWKYILNTYIIPRANELFISEDAYSRVVIKGQHDFLKHNVLRLLDSCEVSSHYVDTCHKVIKMFGDYEILSYEGKTPKLKFTIRGETDGKTREIIEAYILSSAHTDNKVDVAKLRILCAIFGLFGEERDAVLRKIGRKIYHKFLNDHFGVKVSVASLDELKHMHKAYAFEEHDLEKLIHSYREMKLFEVYEPFAGIEGMKKVCEIIDFDEPLSKYDPLSRERRIQWLINILYDLVTLTEEDSNSPKYTLDQFFSLSQQILEFFNEKVQNTCAIPKSDEVQKHDFQSVFSILKTAINKLELTEEEFLEGCFNFADENANKFLNDTLEKLVNLDNAKAAESLSKFIKTASLAPPSKLNLIKTRFSKIRDPEKLRSLFINSVDSDAILGRGCKILDLLLSK